jgi:hypothetical protein
VCITRDTLHKEPQMENRFGVVSMVLCLLTALPGSGAAWNKAGHLVTGASAYSALTPANATALWRAVETLKAPPHFPTNWYRTEKIQEDGHGTLARGIDRRTVQCHRGRMRYESPLPTWAGW